MPFAQPAVASDTYDNAIYLDCTCWDKTAGNNGFRRTRIGAPVQDCLQPRGDCSEPNLTA